MWSVPGKRCQGLCFFLVGGVQPCYCWYWWWGVTGTLRSSFCPKTSAGVRDPHNILRQGVAFHLRKALVGSKGDMSGWHLGFRRGSPSSFPSPGLVLPSFLSHRLRTEL